MFARLFSNNTSIQTAYSEISKVITGVITDPASLTAFNPSTSIITNIQPSNWTEYTSVGKNNQVTPGSVMWFRQRNKSGRWKYAGLYRTSSPNTAHKGILQHYSVDLPTVQSTSIGTATSYSAIYGSTTEYIISAGPRYLIIATKLTSNLFLSDIHMWLEYPENGFGSTYLLPNHLMYRHYDIGNVYSTDAFTDFNFSTGIMECVISGYNSISIVRGGMSSPATQYSTMKPSYYTSFNNTISTSGGPVLSYPILPLFTTSNYHGLLDCSVLTGVLGAGHSITTHGSSIVFNGIDYVFLKSNGCLSYLVPNR